MSSVNKKSYFMINTWQKFAKHVRSEGCCLLKNLDKFPDSVLVAGCQRSGTTMLSRIITQSEGMVNYWFGHDDELDAALILSGRVNHKPKGRYCFQTTYLNECYHEYFEHKGYKMIWVLRNPYSVVYSMLNNWGRFALNELFRGCATDLLNNIEKQRYELFGIWGINRLKRACLSYNGKSSQVFELKKLLGDARMLVIDYDDLVQKKEHVLPAIYKFIDLPYEPGYGKSIRCKKIKKTDRYSKSKKSLIEELCAPIYEDARKLLSKLDK